MWSRLRLYFLAGLVVVAPVAITVVVLRFAFVLLDERAGGWITRLLGFRVPGLGLVLTLALVLALGVVATNVIGGRLIGFVERIFARTPIVRTVYVTAKQISELVLHPDRIAFKRAAFIEYPRAGVYSLAFITGGGVRLEPDGREVKYTQVFIPTSPTPATGFVAVVRQEEILHEMPVEDGIRLVVSLGVLMPPSFYGRPAEPPS